MRTPKKAESARRKTQQQYIEAILLFLHRAETPSCNIKQIAEGIGVNQNTLPKYLNLIENKLIKLQMSGSTKLYYLSEEGRAQVAKLLTQQEQNKG